MLGRTDRRRAKIIGCGVLLLAALGAAGIAAKAPVQRLLAATNAAPDTDLREARITNALDGNGCIRQQFDNKTGRVTRLPEACDSIERDSNGVPIPVGTIHRLDAISKSFSGR
jgi:hypothetical protein